MAKIKVDADVAGVQAELAKVRDHVAKINESLRGGKAAIDTTKARRDLDALTKRAEALTDALERVNRAGTLNKKNAEDAARAFNVAAVAAAKLEKIKGDSGGWSSSWMRQSAREFHQYQPQQHRPDATFFGSVSSMASTAGRGVAGAITPYGGIGSSVMSQAYRDAMGAPGGLRSFGGLARIGAGAGLGALAFAGVRAVQGIGNAMDSASSEGAAYSDLRQAMGATRVEFNALRESIRKATEGYGISYEETAKMAKEFVRTSGAAEDFVDVADQVKTATGFGRGYGIDPSQSSQFLATSRLLGITRGDADARKLALMIGESVARGGTSAKMDEVLSAIQNFMTGAARASFTGANVEGYAAMMSSLTSLPFSGLYGDPGAAAAMLGKADAAIRQGGAFGEASKNFSLGMYQRAMPGFSALDMGLLNEQGAFGSAANAFGSNSPAYLFALHNKDYAAIGRYRGYAESGGTLLDMQMSELQRQYGGDSAGFRKAISTHLGVSETEAMTLFEAFRDKGGFGSMKTSLDRAGVDTSKMNASSIASLAQLWSGDDDAIRAQAKKLLGMDGIKGNKALEGQLSGSGQDLKNAVLKLTSLYDTTKDEGSAARQAQIGLENKFRDYADEIIPIVTRVKDGVIALASKYAPELLPSSKQSLADEELGRIRAAIADNDGGAYQDFLVRGARARHSRHPDAYPDDFSEQLDALERKVLSGKAAGLSDEKRAILNDVARRHKIPSEWLSRVLTLENSRATAVSPRGASGEFQVMPGNSRGTGLDPTKFGDGAELAGRVLEDARRLYGLDDDASMAYYNGGKAQGDLVHGGLSPSIEETRRYLARSRKIEEMSDRLPVVKGASPADQKAQAFSHEINVRLFDRDGRPLAEPHAVSTHVGLPIPAGVTR